MDPSSNKRHSRRSQLNLSQLSVKPLTPQYPLPPTSDLPSPTSASRVSYILPRSLPQTPSLLSRSPSRTRNRAAKSAHALVDLSAAIEPLVQSRNSRSTNTLPSLANSSLRRSKPSVVDSDSTSWLLQTATLLTTTSAESKGQTWLATRSSSTSLAEYTEAPDTSYRADDEFSPVSTRNYFSRPGSRYASARGSRRGSRVGLMTPMGVRTPGETDEGEEDGKRFFGDIGVDFVDADGEAEAEEDEGEMKKLVWGRVGGFVGWATDWLDFRGYGEEELAGTLEEDGIDDEVKDKEGDQIDRRRRRKRRDESDRVVVQRVEEMGRLEVPPPVGDGAWKDAAWLLGVAKKVLI